MQYFTDMTAKQFQLAALSTIGRNFGFAAFAAPLKAKG
jgi:hypothetical protein